MRQLYLGKRMEIHIYFSALSAEDATLEHGHIGVSVNPAD